MFKFFFFISNFTLLKNLIFWLNQLHDNHKSHVSLITITMYHTYVLKHEYYIIIIIFDLNIMITNCQ
jgi:hypothetical protein